MVQTAEPLLPLCHIQDFPLDSEKIANSLMSHPLLLDHPILRIQLKQAPCLACHPHRLPVPVYADCPRCPLGRPAAPAGRRLASHLVIPERLDFAGKDSGVDDWLGRVEVDVERLYMYELSPMGT